MSLYMSTSTLIIPTTIACAGTALLTHMYATHSPADPTSNDTDLRHKAPRVLYAVSLPINVWKTTDGTQV